MKLQGPIEVENTREKLRLLESWLDDRKRNPIENSRAQGLTLRSFRRLIVQLAAEIAEFEAVDVKNPGSPPLRDGFEAEDTRRKLASLERQLALAEENPDSNPVAQDWTVTALRRLAEKLQGEISEFEERTTTSRRAVPGMSSASQGRGS